MMRGTDAIVAVGLLVSVVAVAWVLATPSTAIPVGMSVSSGDSMGYDGARILVYADVEPEQGDVVLFKSWNTWTAHRVVRPVDLETAIGDVEGWQTKGDANKKPDQVFTDDGMRTDQALATNQNTAGVVVAWVGLRFVLEVAASVVAAVASMRGLEATPPKFFARPQGGR